jgi:transcriptional/translational regulatory protein YebC/TACO1
MSDTINTLETVYENQLPADLFAAQEEAYEPTDVFQWANNLVQYKAELNIDLFLFNKNGIVYRTSRSTDLDKQMEPIFIDEILEYVLDGAEKGMVVRGFEDAEAETDVLQRTRVKNVEKAINVLNWVKTQESEMEIFSDETHDIKRMKGAIARVTHKGMDTFYVIKQLPASQMMSGKVGWMVRNGKFVPFDAEAAIRIPVDNQLLVLGSDMYVFSQPKLKSLFGYDAKEAYIADQKVREIEAQFRLSFPDGMTIQNLVKGRRSTIKKLQKIEPTLMTQEQLLGHAEEVGVELMEDDSGAIIIMDEKDLVKFVNLLNDDYMESPVTGLRYEIKSKKPLKDPESKEDDSLLITI